MLLSRLLGWFKAHKTTHIFLLEVLAVFIGITGSLFVDNWRQQRLDRDTLDSELRAFHFELQRSVSNLPAMMTLNNDALESTVLLTFGDTDELEDEELLLHFDRAMRVPVVFFQGDLLTVSNADLALPYNKTLALIEAFQQDLLAAEGLFRYELEQLNVRQNELVRTADLVFNVGAGVSGISDSDLVNDVTEMYELTGGLGNEFIADKHNLGAVREALADPAVGAQLRHLIPLRQSMGITITSLIGYKRDLIEAVLRYDPDMTVPITEVGIDGSGTLFGWQTYLVMTQDDDDPETWRITLDLVDGEVKFRADEAWAVNWGTGESRGADWFFEGDKSKAFPTGTATLNGANIPVTAGRYDVTFNTETLEYSFELVEETD